MSIKISIVIVEGLFATVLIKSGKLLITHSIAPVAFDDYKTNYYATLSMDRLKSVHKIIIHPQSSGLSDTLIYFQIESLPFIHLKLSEENILC